MGRKSMKDSASILAAIAVFLLMLILHLGKSQTDRNTEDINKIKDDITRLKEITKCQ